MKVSFFEKWVTFYPSEHDLRSNSYCDQSVLMTITIGEALAALNCMLLEDGIGLPISVPIGSGTEWQCYQFKAGEATHEAIISDHATRCWINYHLMARLSKSQSKNKEA